MARLEEENLKLDLFKSTVASYGLAKSSQWVCRVFPPANITAEGKAINDIFNIGGNRINLNLPGLDILNRALDDFDQNAIGALNNLDVDLGIANIGTNFDIPTLGYLISGHATGMNAINLYCNSCSIPARDMLGSEWSEYGETRTLGVKHTHSDLMVSYYCSEDLKERLFFEQWQNLIFNPSNKRHSYYKDYVSQVEIVKYDSGWKNRTAKYLFHEAYPTNVGETALNYEGTDLIRLDIAFKYRYFERTA